MKYSFFLFSLISFALYAEEACKSNPHMKKQFYYRGYIIPSLKIIGAGIFFEFGWNCIETSRESLGHVIKGMFTGDYGIEGHSISYQIDESTYRAHSIPSTFDSQLLKSGKYGLIGIALVYCSIKLFIDALTTLFGPSTIKENSNQTSVENFYTTTVKD